MTKKVENVLEALEAFKTQGFDRIHIPGGTSKDGKHYAGVFLFYHDREEKEIYFIGVPYNSNFHKTEDANGHTKKLGETPEQTAIRETQEETGLLIDKESLDKIDHYAVPSKNNPGEMHNKHFYLTSQFRGGLFDFQGKPNNIDAETGSPIWIPLSLFSKVLFGAKPRPGKHGFYGHRNSLEKALLSLMADRDMYNIIQKHGLMPVGR